jgi:hypothetical protein
MHYVVTTYITEEYSSWFVELDASKDVGMDIGPNSA